MTESDEAFSVAVLEFLAAAAGTGIVAAHLGSRAMVGLAAQGHAVHIIQLAVLAVEKAFFADLAQDADFQSGRFSIQSESSMMAAMAV